MKNKNLSEKEETKACYRCKKEKPIKDFEISFDFCSECDFEMWTEAENAREWGIFDEK